MGQIKAGLMRLRRSFAAVLLVALFSANCFSAAAPDENFEQVRQAGKAFNGARWFGVVAFVFAAGSALQYKDSKDGAALLGIAGISSIISFAFDWHAGYHLASVTTSVSDAEEARRKVEEERQEQIKAQAENSTEEEKAKQAEKRLEKRMEMDFYDHTRWPR